MWHPAHSDIEDPDIVSKTLTSLQGSILKQVLHSRLSFSRPNRNSFPHVLKIRDFSRLVFEKELYNNPALNGKIVIDNHQRNIYVAVLKDLHALDGFLGVSWDEVDYRKDPQMQVCDIISQMCFLFQPSSCGLFGTLSVVFKTKRKGQSTDSSSDSSDTPIYD